MYVSENDKHRTNGIIHDILYQLINKYDSSNNIIIACIFKKTKILSYGISKPDIHLHSIKNNKQFSVHAEVDAIKNYIQKFNKKQRNQFGLVDMLITRYNKKIDLLPTQSCQHCIKSMNKFDCINKLYYTNNNNIYESNFKNVFNHISNYDYSKGDKKKKKK
jgi:hypothetical protein